MPTDPSHFLLLAQNSSDGSVQSTFVAVIVVLAACVVLLLGFWYVRTVLRDSGGEQARDFSMSDLRQLVREGKMTQEEYDRAKGSLIAKEQSKLQRDAANPDRKPDSRVEVKP